MSEIKIPTQHDYMGAALAALGEISKAKQKHGNKDFTGGHHGYAILLEEVDEMWDAIKKDDIEHAVYEAKQVAAMALRFMAELGNPPYNKPIPAELLKVASYYGGNDGAKMATDHYISDRPAAKLLNQNDFVNEIDNPCLNIKINDPAGDRLRADFETIPGMTRDPERVVKINSSPGFGARTIHH